MDWIVKCYHTFLMVRLHLPAGQWGPFRKAYITDPEVSPQPPDTIHPKHLVR